LGTCRIAQTLINVTIIATFFLSCAAINKKSKLKDNRFRVIIDADANNELDDQHALAYTLFNGNMFDVEGITVNRTRNGGDINKHFEEAERIVKLCALYPKIKVYKGASGQYKDIKDHIHESHFDGEDAVNFIIERAKIKDERKLVLIPIGKLTNIALALKKDPSIESKIRIVWIGTNWPDSPGDYNSENDNSAMNPVLESGADFEIAVVRNGKPSGNEAVKASIKDIRTIMPGKGPHIKTPIAGRNGGMFANFGDYSVDLFDNYNQAMRSLFDVCAVAVVKNSAWADRVEIRAPKWIDGRWKEQPNNNRKIIIWENYDKKGIIQDFYWLLLY